MKCYKCKEKIDFELSEEEEKNIQKELDNSGVIMVCYKCYEPLEGLSQKLIQDLK